MKLEKGLVFTLYLLFTTHCVFAENGNWTSQTSGVTNQLRSVYFIDSQHGWICASNGVILKTTNSGNSWNIVQSNTTYTLSSIYFIDSLTGFAAGFNGTLLKTFNGGESWYPLPTGTSSNLYEIYFYDNLTGWVVGNSGTILKTTNGGNSWSSVNYGYYNDLFTVFFITPQTGWVAGNGQKICRTTDGGHSWESYFDYSLSWLQSIKFTDTQNGLAVGSEGNVLKTTDSGMSWEWVNAAPVDYQEIANLGNNYSLIIGKGSIYTSSNSGDNWTVNANPTSVQLNGVSFPDENNGWAVGDNGVILRYSSWVKLPVNTNTNFSKVFFSDSEKGIVCGNGSIIKTTNGGIDWTTSYADYYHNYNDFYFKTKNIGFVCGNGGHLLKTSNFGNNWMTVPTGTNEDLNDIYFYDNNNGWIACNNGIILKTTDAGTSWTVVPYLDKENLRAIHFVSLLDGYVASSAGSIAATTDGGKTWNKFWRDPGDSFTAAAFNDSYSGIITSSGGKVIKASRKENSWNKIFTGVTADILSACSIGSTLTWASGTSGTILLSTDKGLTWNKEVTTTGNSLKGIYFLNESQGWAVGDNGTILRSYYIKPKQNMYSVTISKAGSGSGSLYINNELKAPEATGTYAPGASITIKAIPDENSEFTGWSGSLNSPENEISFIINSNKIITANFASKSSISIESNSGLNNNQEFEVNIKVNNVDSLKVLSFDLSYPTLYLDYVSYSAGDFLPNSSSTILVSEIDGKISNSTYTLTGFGSGSGTIIKLKFKITQALPDQSNIQFCISNILANDLNNEIISLAEGCGSINISGLKVWPGDANNDNVVNITDINPVIVYFNSYGPARPQAGISWAESFSYPWTPIAKTYADCNGNGKIEITDINAVIVNFNKSHAGSSNPETSLTKTNGVISAYSPDPILSVGISKVSPESDEFWADISLGTSPVPVQNVNIISIELYYTGSDNIDYLGYEPGTFMNGSNFTVIPEENIGRISASAYNTSTGYSGYGKVFKFKFKASGNIIPDIMFYWGLVSVNRADGSSVYVDTIGYKGGVVPVELQSFNSEMINNKIYLSWSTASETNNKGFEIERLFIEQNNWKSIGFVPGAGTTAVTTSYQYIDNPSISGSYSYRLKQIDFDGTFEYSQVLTIKTSVIPEKLSLGQNYPNPFNPLTTINYSLPEESFVTIKVYDVIGNEVDVLVNGRQTAGQYSIPFNAGNLSSGIYFYTLTTGTNIIVKKMQLIK